MIVVAKKLVKPAKKPVQAVAPEPQEMEQDAQATEMVQPEATVTKQYPDGTTTEAKEPVGGPIIVKPPMANVGVTMGLTKNLGDYNNMKFSVSLHLPCEVDVDQINETYDQAKQWVDERLNEINEEIEQQLAGEEAAQE